jgi:hypothetical protein
MPKVSEFYGIQIMFYLNDHGVPHFHARYAGKRASIAIESLEVLEGSISPRASRLVFEWAMAHRAELLERWHEVRAGRLPTPIPPLE